MNLYIIILSSKGSKKQEKENLNISQYFCKVKYLTNSKKKKKKGEKPILVQYIVLEKTIVILPPFFLNIKCFFGREGPRVDTVACIYSVSKLYIFFQLRSVRNALCSESIIQEIEFCFVKYERSFDYCRAVLSIYLGSVWSVHNVVP